MMKQIAYFIFFILACDVVAQTSDTTKSIITSTVTIIPTETVQTQSPTTITGTTDTIHSIPTQTVQPVTVTTQTLHPTMPNIKRRRKLNETLKKENQEIATLYKEPFDKKKEIVLQNKRYRIYNNYITAGAGKCYNSGWKDLELNTAVDYNFHIKRNRFQIGALLAGPALRDNNCVQLHAGWGYRMDRCNYHWAVYGGISYSQGYRLQWGTPQNVDTIYKYNFSTIGAYANLQLFYKLKFDYGLGASAFVDANNKQVLTGIRIELFLSGAYKGLKRINYAKEEEKER